MRVVELWNSVRLKEEGHDLVWFEDGRNPGSVQDEEKTFQERNEKGLSGRGL